MIRRRVFDLSFLVVISFSLCVLLTPRPDSGAGLEGLDDQALHEATGADPHKIRVNYLTCEENQANGIIHESDDEENVGSANCNTDHAGYACWSCQPPDPDLVSMIVTTDPNRSDPPGLKVNDIVTCGPASVGICKQVSAAWTCADVKATMGTCFDVTQFRLQGY